MVTDLPAVLDEYLTVLKLAEQGCAPDDSPYLRRDCWAARAEGLTAGVCRPDLSASQVALIPVYAKILAIEAGLRRFGTGEFREGGCPEWPAPDLGAAHAPEPDPRQAADAASRDAADAAI